MAYKIVITKIESVDHTVKEWVKLFDYTEAEQKEIRHFQNERKDFPEQYGYKETPSTKKVETEILSQVIESINLINVIKAINSIPE